ncbi:hypothetical protein SNEBB_000588 [Seison nebaliae]|nr:hypothetical protein SNEBB_000588 [Seison nebaliae]
MKMNDKHLMEFAINEAKLCEKCEVPEVPVACAIFLRNEENLYLVGKGHNETIKECDPTRHAEIVAIENLKRKLKFILELFPLKFDDLINNLIFYVTMEPCIMCADLLRQLKIKSIIYGCKNDRFGGCGTVIDVFDVDVTSSQMKKRRRFNDSIFIRLIDNESIQEKCVELIKLFYSRQNPATKQEG